MVPAGLHILLLREKGETDYAQSVGTCIILRRGRAFYRPDLPENFFDGGDCRPVSPGRL